MSRIDYSKFDNICCSSEEDDCEEITCSSAFPQGFPALPGFPGSSQRSSQPSGAPRVPKYVKPHPKDDLKGLHPVFFEDPMTFVPKPTSKGDFNIGRIIYWGVTSSDTPKEGNPMLGMMRLMHTQSLYGPAFNSPDKGLDSPEVQFVKALIRKKEAKLKAMEKTVQALSKSDLILDIDLDDVQPRVWRRFKVSAGMKLCTFQDKVISPIMGWARHYHAYNFMDVATDGAVWGPVSSGAIDMMHKSSHGYEWLDDREYVIAHLLQKRGDFVAYMYDLGDSFWHTITVVEVLPPEKSDGRCCVLDGAMGCPAEDSAKEVYGNLTFQRIIDMLQSKENSKKMYELLADYQHSENYKDKVFDPFKFSVSEKQAELEAALKTKASATGGQKATLIPFCANSNPERNPLFNRAGKGEKASVKPRYGEPMMHNGKLGVSSTFLTETLRTGRDPKILAVCAECGSPNNLQMCAGCREVRFCGKACLQTAWKGWHKVECKKVQAARAAKAKGAVK